MKNPLKDKLIFDAAILSAGTISSGLCNLLYHFAAVRLLSAQDYGALNALISLLTSLLIGISPLNTTFTRFFTEYAARKDYGLLFFIVKKLIKRLAVLAAAIFLIASFFCAPAADFLHVPAQYLFICAAVIAFSVFPPLFLSVIQSFQRFVLFSAVTVSTALGKFALGVPLMFIGFGVAGGLSGVLFAVFASAVISWIFASRIFKEVGASAAESVRPVINTRALYSYFFPVSVIMAAYSILINVDIVIVKHFFSPADAGSYSIAQMTARVALFLPSALAVIVSPKSTQAFVNNRHSPKVIYKPLILAALACGIFTAACALFPAKVIAIFAGKPNPVSESLVGIFCLAMSFYALSWITINFLMGVHYLRAAVPLALICLGQAAVIYLRHSDLRGVVNIVLVFSMLTFAASMFMSRLACAREEK